MLFPKPQTQLSIKRETSRLSLGLNRPEREADPLLLPSAEITNSHSCTFTTHTCLQGTPNYSFLWLTLPKLCMYVYMNAYVIDMIYDIFS